MNVLPKFLYLFQNLPIFLTKSFFLNLDSQISAFIWNKKQPRIGKNVLQMPRTWGGMSLPNFRYYYWAANIRTLMYWMRSDADNLSWLILEKASIERTSPAALLCSKLPFNKPISNFTSNITVIHTLKIWNQFRRSFNMTELLLAAPVTKNHMFAPSIIDNAFDSWSQIGIKSLYDLYIEDKFASFEQISQKFGIHKSDFFRYLQVRCFVASNSDCFPLCPPTSLLDSIFKCFIVSKQIISKIYKLINSHQVTSLESLKHAWEADLEEPISELVWQKIIQRIYSSSVCQRHAVVQFKIVHRLHWSKERLSKFKPDLDTTCDRCKQFPATLLHMFWTCPRLYGFWRSIFEAFSKICGKTVHPSPLISLFGVTPVDISLSKCNINMIAFCSLLARRLILSKWKDSQPPAYGHWIREVMYHIHLEKIRYTTRGSVGKFYSIWQPFMTFVGDVAAANFTE